MNRWSLGILVAACAWSEAQAEPKVKMECPPELLVQQIVRAPVPWKAAQTGDKHPFVRLTLFDGPPEHRDVLKPDRVGDGTAVENDRWTLEPTADVWAGCEYQGTSVLLVQAAHQSVKQCVTKTVGSSKALECE